MTKIFSEIVDGVVIEMPPEASASFQEEQAVFLRVSQQTLRDASVVAVKAECRRRILLVMTEDEQRNTLAAGQAAMMQHGPNPADWPPELRYRQQAVWAAWAKISQLRAKSDEVEKLDPIPTDIGDNELWEEI